MDYASKRERLDYNVITNHSLKYMDYSLLFIVFCLLVFGLVSLYSASAIYASNKGLNSFYFVKRQGLYMLGGLILTGVIIRLDLEKIRHFIKPAVLATIALLVITLFMRPVAHVRRWIPLGIMKLQMSEFAKIALILYLADYFDKNNSQLQASWKAMVKPYAITGIVCALIALEPDLGTPALIFLVALMLFFAAGAKLKHIFLPLTGVLPVFIFELFRHPYRIARLKTFLSPWQDASGTGYQLVQSLLAVGSGGWLGKGLGASKLKLMYLPEPHTDFIFPVIAEELGLAGGLLIVALFTAFLIKGVRVARNAPSLYTTLAALGLSLTVTLQAFFNLSMAIGIIPTKGIPLPFFSYGGSSILASLMAVGLILNISAHRSPVRW
ncbi:MAG: putative lipid II flippase FtsW [Elusimicrobia bacterium]|nr:putative lipid II flippase FtsW [Elusimicrobiota bacterium]